MIKAFCDGCLEEIKRNYVSDRFKPEILFISAYPPGAGGVKITLEVAVIKGSTANAGHLCKKCLKEVFNSGVDVCKVMGLDDEN